VIFALLTFYRIQNRELVIFIYYIRFERDEWKFNYQNYFYPIDLIDERRINYIIFNIMYNRIDVFFD
jgi:hypothetical protein